MESVETAYGFFFFCFSSPLLNQRDFWVRFWLLWLLCVSKEGDEYDLAD